MRIFDIKWRTGDAGPSPNKGNERIELYLKGCKRAEEGNPCKGCFNYMIWDSSAEREHDPKEVAAHINSFDYEKYITIVGGEPFDQLDDLIMLCKELKKYKFHVIIFTHHEIIDFINSKDSKVSELFNYVDIIIDGEYKEEQKIYDLSIKNGLNNAIGSGNQTVWTFDNYHDNREIIGYKAEHIKEFKVYKNNKTEIVSDKNIKIFIEKGK